MGISLMRAAHSPNIKERRDFSCAVFDAAGQLLAQAAHIPVHLGALPASVASARGAVTSWKPGDVAVLNDPYAGGSHLPDITTVSPVFRPADVRAPAFYLATRAHHADVGGSEPGSLPSARDVYGEGLVIPPVLLAVDDALRDDIASIVCANSRTPGERRGDLEAQLAAHAVGERRLREIMASTDDLEAGCDAMLAWSERLARQRVANFGPGEWWCADVLETPGHGPGEWQDGQDSPLEIKVRVRIDESGMIADFSGSGKQVRIGVNSPRAVTLSAVFYVVACIIGDTPLNAGAFRWIDVRIPDGCLLAPRRPAPVALGNVETSQRVVDVLLGALGRADPERIPASSQGTMNNVLAGGIEGARSGESDRVDLRTGEHEPIGDSERETGWAYYETLGGGCGASAEGAGASGLQSHMTNTRNTPIEALETALPVRIERYELRSGSGGGGIHRGGEGLIRSYRFLERARLTLATSRRRRGPRGLAGGTEGAVGENLLVGRRGDIRRLPATVSLDVAPGEAIEVRTPGGGGWGDSQPPKSGQRGTT